MTLLPRQRLREFDDLLERRAVLERERRHGDGARADPAIHVKAAGPSVFGADAVAVDLRGSDGQRFEQRVLERRSARFERAFAAVDL